MFGPISVPFVISMEMLIESGGTMDLAWFARFIGMIILGALPIGIFALGNDKYFDAGENMGHGLGMLFVYGFVFLFVFAIYNTLGFNF